MWSSCIIWTLTVPIFQLIQNSRQFFSGWVFHWSCLNKQFGEKLSNCKKCTHFLAGKFKIFEIVGFLIKFTCKIPQQCWYSGWFPWFFPNLNHHCWWNYINHQHIWELEKENLQTNQDLGTVPWDVEVVGAKLVNIKTF